MFNKIRLRLLLSYLLVLASILGVFALAVRIFFTHSLTQELTDKLIDLGEGAAANASFENGHVKIENEFSVQSIIAHHQALQWFDTKGHLIDQQGNDVLQLPLAPNQTVQLQLGENHIQAVTLPILGSDDGKLIGYVRASQSLKEFDATLNKLDWGFGGGIIVALILTGVGGVYLTRQAMQPIEDSFQQLKQFTADASHELRSPLMAIKSNAAVALKYPEGIRETDLEKFQVIVSATNQMTRLTEDLLFLARNDKLPNHLGESVDLTAILDTLINLYEPLALAKDIQLKNQLKNQLNNNLYLSGDSVQLTRLFTNLIENAIHYTPSEGIIEVSASRVASQIIVKVKDTGVGIAPEHINKVFERFWRADKSRSYWNGGSGLGLAIVQTIVKNHGGSITVTSELGVGSCFTVSLPANLSS